MGSIPRPLLLVVFAAIVALAATACARHGEPARLSFHEMDCHVGCFTLDVDLARDGSVSIQPAFPGLPVRRDPRYAAYALSHIPEDALRHCPTSPVRNADVLSLTVTYSDGSTVQCQVPASRPPSPEMSALYSFAVDIDHFTMRALGSQLTQFRRAITGNALDGIRLDRSACYGTCPSYVVTFSRDGSASIDLRDRFCPVRARATVPLARARAALLAANFEFSQPSYPRVWTDTAGASISIVTRAHTFTVDAPDSMSWGPEFASAVERLDQLVLDADWQPRLPERRIDGSLSCKASVRQRQM